ncbi:MAG: hypothetical protein DI563_20180 [Variovorax paradoxus]|uniref:DhaL domain-containing protein n=1 Tax=Variovorax paradoxus TaxID=34073 RepID=A0A2W5Q256_VARPD|nr:MAG: hypothetical protein DI563_20180 [Variovorax paradoxus]
MLDAQTLAAALPKWCAGVHRAAPELNELDGRLGDADLGATLDKCATLVEQALPEMAGAPLDAMLRRCAQACAKASGSSFGTLLTVALMTAAKRCAGTDALDRPALAALLGEIGDTLAARGGASLGDKTVLDSLHAVRQALAEAPDGRQDHRHGRPGHGGTAAHGREPVDLPTTPLAEGAVHEPETTQCWDK